MIKQDYFPWILLGVSLVAYGTLIWDLGFYWDDWEILYLSKAAENPSDIFLFPFRPLHVLLDILTVKLIGLRPIYWHLLMLLVRYLGGLVYWLILQEIWPNETKRNAWVALIFLVYPSFLHQSMGVVYRQHFTTVLLFLISVWLMIQGYKLWKSKNKRGPFWIIFALSLVTGMMHLFVTEYLAGMELWRPAILLILVLEEKPLWKQRLRSVFFFWLPYLVYLMVYVLWRLTYVKTVIDDPNKAVLLEQFGKNPLGTFLNLIVSVIQDSVFVLFTSWGDLLQPESINLIPSNILIFGLMVIIGLTLSFLIPKLAKSDGKYHGHSTEIQAILLGGYGLLLGLAPAWIIGRNVFAGRYDTRFSIPALVGVSLLLVTVIYYLISNPNRRIIVLSFMMALSIGKQIEMTNNFRWDWIRQERFYWQLQWRAPEIKPHTALLTNKSVSSFATTYPIAYAINIMHSDQKPSMSPEYWWFEIYKDRLYLQSERLLTGSMISSEFHNVTFSTNSENSLLFDIPVESTSNRCIWMLTSIDKFNTIVAKEMRVLSMLANPSLINEGPTSNQLLTILGEEPEKTWCYYFQKAQLAQQQENWHEVMNLYNQAVDHSLRPSNGYEYSPFIVASASNENWKQAQKLTLDGYKITPSAGLTLCKIWEEFKTNDSMNSDLTSAYDEVADKLECNLVTEN